MNLIPYIGYITGILFPVIFYPFLQLSIFDSREYPISKVILK